MQRADFQTAVWRRLEEDMRTRLQELRELNDRQTQNELQTAATRGQIAEVKRLLALSSDSAGDAAEPGESWPPQTAE